MMFARTGQRNVMATAAAALSMLLIAAGAGLSQSAGPSLGLQEQPQEAPPQGEASAAPPSRPENPGLFNEMGKLFDKLPAILPPLKSPSETLDDLNARAKEAARDAGDAVSRLARPSSMVSGRIVCPAASNGTPDCKQGADRLCQSKGYREGRSLNTDAVEACSAKVLIPGRQRKPDDCRTNSYVTAALCQ
jgi:hypothetical protein